jgi:hypothetical protein
VPAKCQTQTEHGQVDFEVAPLPFCWRFSGPPVQAPIAAHLPAPGEALCPQVWLAASRGLDWRFGSGSSTHLCRPPKQLESLGLFHKKALNLLEWFARNGLVSTRLSDTRETSAAPPKAEGSKRQTHSAIITFGFLPFALAVAHLCALELALWRLEFKSHRDHDL